MESRAYKYKDTSNDEQPKISRSSRNSKLYQEVYGKYGDLDNLPIQDNTSEIDMDRLKEIVNHKEEQPREVKEYQELSSERPTITRKNNYQYDNQQVHDINKLIEKAKYENDKLKEPVKKTTQINRNILETLESRELSLEEIKKACKKYETSESNITIEDELSMTREMKYRTRQISANPLIEQVMPDSSDALDLFEDLKPTGNTIITKPITEEQSTPFLKKSQEKVEDNFHSSDTRDIDIIKNTIPKNNNTYSKKTSNIDNDFYTSTNIFTEKDFFDDDYLNEGKNNNILKIILLIIAIIVFAFIIYYFIKNYGLGI